MKTISKIQTGMAIASFIVAICFGVAGFIVPPEGERIAGLQIFPVGVTIFKNKVLSLPYEIRSATSRHPSGCANRQL